MQGQIEFLLTEISSAIVNVSSSPPSADKCLITDERKQLRTQDIFKW